MKNIAIITGAAGGIGREFVAELTKEDLDEIWVIGRNAAKLNALQKTFQELSTAIIPLQMDLTNEEELRSLAELLNRDALNITYLINNAGISQMKPSSEFSPEELSKTIDLNCKVPVILINICLPHMTKGSHILNISSASSFQPVPYINLYASTKAFERSYSRALGEELKDSGIIVTAVCPSWVDTDMLEKEINGKKVHFPGIVTATRVAAKALKDTKKGKDMSVCSLYVKCQHLYVKLWPAKWSMKIWLHGVKKYR